MGPRKNSPDNLKNLWRRITTETRRHRVLIPQQITEGVLGADRRGYRMDFVVEDQVVDELNFNAPVLRDEIVRKIL